MRPTFPDRPMSAGEYRSIQKANAGVRTYYFDESWHRTEWRSVEATSEDEAWNLYEAGKSEYVTIVYDDECVDVDLVRDEVRE